MQLHAGHGAHSELHNMIFLNLFFLRFWHGSNHSRMCGIPPIHDSLGRVEDPCGTQPDTGPTGGRERGDGMGQFRAEYNSEPYRSRGKLNLFMMNGHSKCYHLCESIIIFRGTRSDSDIFFLHF